MVWTSANGPKCPVSPEDRGEFMEPAPAPSVRTITITEDKSGVFFATSEDGSGLFCAATSLLGILDAIRRVASALSRPEGK